MRRGLVIAGIVLLLIGVVLAVLPLLQTSAIDIPAYPSDNTITPNMIGPGSITITWSGAPSSTHVVVFPCSGGTCSGSATPIANVSGGSGTITFTASSGSSYAVTEFNGGASVSGTVKVGGLVALQLIGIVLLVIGLVLVVLGLRGRARAPAPESVEPAPAPVETGVMGNPTESASAPEAVYMAPPSTAASASPGGSPGARANRQCASCGTMNEPWITNCRKCKRPLASTGQ